MTSRIWNQFKKNISPDMLQYLLKKSGYSILVILGVVMILTILFFTFLSNDGKAVYEMVGQNADEKTIEKIKKEYALEKPPVVQMLLYINDLSPLSFHHNNEESTTDLASNKYTYYPLLHTKNFTFVLKKPYFRKSYQTNRNVSNIIIGVLPNTAILAFSAMLIASFLGIGLGIISAFHKNTGLDRFILFFSTTGMALPSFFGAILFSWLFGYVFHHYTGLMPWGNLYVIDDYTGEKFISLKNLILPSITLGIRPLSVIAQLTRNSLLDVMNSDYVRTARAKGISEFKVLFLHTLRNTLNPLITAISGWMGGLLAGAVFIEYIFGWKGIGKEIVDGLQKLDYPVVIGCVITVSFIFVVINVIVDLLYGWVDPRIRISQK